MEGTDIFALGDGIHLGDNVNDPNYVAKLIAELISNDPVVRESARLELVQIGGPEVTKALVFELVDHRKRARWEATKALVSIADPVAAPALMHALEDDDEDVRWLAAEGLIALGKVGLMTVLSGLTKRAGSVEFCKCAHHVLHDLKKRENLDAITPVLEALDSLQPQIAAPVAAHRASVILKQ